MMFIDNEDVKLHKIIRQEIAKSDEIVIASPFVSGNDLVYNIMDQNLKATLIMRLSPPATPAFLEELLSLVTKDKHIYYFESSSFHSKIYFFRKNNTNISAIIGSSNLTNGGLRDNYEYNILVQEDLSQVKSYLDSMIKKSDGVLSREVIEYYKEWYTPIKTPKRYKKRAIGLSNKNARVYQQIIGKWDFIRGILGPLNGTDLPFTYVFDAFCHYFKVGIKKDYSLTKYATFNKDDFIQYFSIFLSKYFPEDDNKWRQKRLKECQALRYNIEHATVYELRDFFLRIHSISNGSGSGNRMKHFREDATEKDMRRLLHFIIRERLSMSEKFALGLKDKSQGGEKIEFVGNSSLGEIPGWLIPEEYPIVNGKFLELLDFWALLNKDAEQ